MTQREAMSLKLMIDKRGKRILYAEADKKFIDFLFTILSLPVGTMVKLLSTASTSAAAPNIIPMTGSLPSLYRSADTLNLNYFELNRYKENLLNPKLPPKFRNLLQMGSSSSSSGSPSTQFYTCSSSDGSTNVCRYSFSDSYWATCSKCSKAMTTEAAYAHFGEGYVRGGLVTYMVMDDLTVKPITSSMSTISVLTQLNVEDVRQIEEKIVPFHLNNEGIKLLRASLHSHNVLTDVFYWKLDLSTKPVKAETTKRKKGNIS